MTSCNKDDSGLDKGIEKVIIGQWDSEFLGKMSYEEAMSLDLNDETLDSHYMYFTFNVDGRGYDIYYSGSRSDWEWDIIDNMITTSNGDLYEIVKYNDNVIYLLRQNYYEAGIKLVRIK